VPGGDLTWTVESNTTGASVGISNNKAEDPTVTLNGFGSVTLKLTASNPQTGPNCVPASDTVTLTLYQNPAANAGGDLSACENTASHQFTISGSTATVPAGGQITWSGPAGVTFDDTHALHPVVTVSSFGTKTLTMSVSNPQSSAGCTTASDTVDVTLNQNPVVTIADVSCNAAAGGTSITLEAVVGAGGGVTNTFVWKKNGQTVGNAAQLNVTTPGTYTVEVTATHANGQVSCTSTKSKNVGLCAANAAP
jgi:hypothetical protein